ncbi:MAG: hypothetical protein MUF10_05995 [Thermoanaerobaculaceae bacterium]|jgi:hypothetical protein|nr:hypothetical protein [Thermoanaerobaculaceae bacterium]
MSTSTPLSTGRIARFWAPLAATWLMMAAEGPFVAALIARLAEPKLNLAAWGVAIAFAMLIEAPVIMIMSAATALVRDRASFGAMRRFIYVINGGVTLVMLALLLPPVFRLVAGRLIGLPDEVVRLAHLATGLLLPWPAAIGYRRFYQGILIGQDLTRRVAYGTLVRLGGMATVGLTVYRFTSLPGVCVGALALSAGVVLEAAATRLWARQAVRTVRSREPRQDAVPLTTARMVRFYLPLALTSLLAIGVHPLVTFLVARSRMSLESLAVLPVVTGLVFVFRSGGIALQEVCIALLGDDRSGRHALASFAAVLAAASTGALALVAFTPAAHIWLERVSGLKPDLAAFALLPLALLVLMPAFEALLNYQRALLVHAHRTPPITWATGIEVAGIALVIAAGTLGFDLVGAVAAASGLVVGRLLATGYLCRVLRSEGGCPVASRTVAVAPPRP